MSEIEILHLGVEDYSSVFETMKILQRKRIDDEISDTLIFVIHPEVVTLGPKAIREGVEIEDYQIFETDRGGGATWHGPGQLVVYPIIKWGGKMQSVKSVISVLEDWAISALKECGIDSYKDHAMQGVWVDGYKICSIGLSFFKWVSRHGLSINVNTPGSRVEGLSGCGMGEGVHTCLHKLGYLLDKDGNDIDIKRVEHALIDTCEEILGRVPSYHLDKGV
ncbi:MAG TPA: lipoyl(octanoyl) transferase LipB [Candidatus Thalassarchaeaceae archaeon]|nr:lipoyl(octanoyl) transferase [Euryarchaeota archaeon]DAC45149.1 MAG TPA: lipoyl(octanoyl) transferase [Candidatus Poseidoniales archaeon]HII34497.1 lipoyl(octanoyl) transferase LipB [Candidatus Thalassarchaeaceae archaeon]